MNDKERLQILSNAIWKMAEDAATEFEKHVSPRENKTINRQEWKEYWIDEYLSIDLLEPES